MRKEFYDAFDTVAKAQRTQTLLDFVFQWVYTSIESKQSKATNLKSNSAYHQKRKAFVLLSFFMDEKELSVPDDPLLFTTWKAAFVMSANNSIERFLFSARRTSKHWWPTLKILSIGLVC